jgi:hypothetical protein
MRRPELTEPLVIHSNSLKQLVDCLADSSSVRDPSSQQPLIGDRSGPAGIGPEPLLIVLTDRNHSNAPSITRHHTLAEERALIVTRRDSVPVGKSTVVIVPVAVHQPVSTEASSVGSSSVEAAPMGVAAMEAATTSPIEAVALEAGAMGRRQVCTDCSEGG